MTEDYKPDYQAHSIMLGRISSICSDFCESDSDTTILAVARLKAYYREYQAKEAWELVSKLEQEAIEQKQP
jgi:hypothetical protein